MNLIPAPKKASLQEDTRFPLGDSYRVSSPPEGLSGFSLLAQRLQKHCNQEIVFLPDPESPDISVCLGQAQLHPDGWYRITIEPATITIAANDTISLGYALTTVFHLFREYREAGSLPCGEIEDWPDYPHRGQHLDTVRHFFPISEIEKLIEQLSLLKINEFHWVFANDQAWRLESLRYPRLTDFCAPECYSREEVRELVAFALERGVQIIPEFEIPGHSSAAISAYPELCCSGKQISPPTTGGIFPYIFCAGKPSTYDFLTGILEELLELFPGQYIHLGGDEAPMDEWEKCPHCQKKLKELGYTDCHALQGELLHYANEIVKAHGRQAICWNEALLAENLDNDLTVQYWVENGQKGYTYPQVAAGRRAILSNFRPFYLDYPYSISNLKDVYTYEPDIGGQRLENADCVAGFESTLWTEHITDSARLEYLMFPRAAATAERGWGGKRDYEDFRHRLEGWYPLFQACGIAAAPLEDAEITGRKRVLANIRYAGFMLKFVLTMRKSKKKMMKENTHG